MLDAGITDVTTIANELGVEVIAVRAAMLNIQGARTDAEVEQAIIKDYVEHPELPMKTICIKHLRNIAQAYAILDRHGIPRRRTQMAYSAESVAAKKAQLNDAVARYELGETIASIVHNTGVSQPTLHYELHRRGVEMRRSRRTPQQPTHMVTSTGSVLPAARQLSLFDGARADIEESVARELEAEDEHHYGR
jgi:hypothetical protein